MTYSAKKKRVLETYEAILYKYLAHEEDEKKHDH